MPTSELPLPGDEREEHRGRRLGADVAHGAAAAGAPGPRGGPPRAPRAEDERRGREEGRAARRRGETVQVSSDISAPLTAAGCPICSGTWVGSRRI